MASRRSRRSSSGKQVALGVVFVCAGLALGGFLLSGGIQPNTETQRPVEAPSSLDILVASQPIEEGTELTPALFRKDSRPIKDFQPSTVVGSFEQLRGVYAKSFVAAGTPLLLDHLTSQPPINGVVPKIRPGYRAITLKLDKQTTNEGWARAGVRVDAVLATTQGTQSSAAVIAQNIRVLSSGTSLSSEFGGESKLIQDGESTVTLEVSTEDQKRLKLAAGRGTLRLLLRGDDDTVNLDEKLRVSLDSIIAAPSEGPKAGPPDQGWVMIDGQKYRLVGASLIPG